jgi:hypothetical protein
MIRHCVTFRFVPGTTDDSIAALEQALRRLPDTIEAIEAYWVGRDLGLRDTNADFAVIADLADEDAFRTYSRHPAHLAVIDELGEPITAERNAVQFSW